MNRKTEDWNAVLDSRPNTFILFFVLWWAASLALGLWLTLFLFPPKTNLGRALNILLLAFIIIPLPILFLSTHRNMRSYRTWAGLACCLSLEETDEAVKEYLGSARVAFEAVEGSSKNTRFFHVDRSYEATVDDHQVLIELSGKADFTDVHVGPIPETGRARFDAFVEGLHGALGDIETRKYPRMTSAPEGGAMPAEGVMVSCPRALLSSKGYFFVVLIPFIIFLVSLTVYSFNGGTFGGQYTGPTGPAALGLLLPASALAIVLWGGGSMTVVWPESIKMDGRGIRREGGAMFLGELSFGPAVVVDVLGDNDDGPADPSMIKGYSFMRGHSRVMFGTQDGFRQQDMDALWPLVTQVTWENRMGIGKGFERMNAMEKERLEVDNPGPALS
jgi:hypothetical protein